MVVERLLSFWEGLQFFRDELLVLGKVSQIHSSWARTRATTVFIHFLFTSQSWFSHVFDIQAWNLTCILDTLDIVPPTCWRELPAPNDRGCGYPFPSISGSFGPPKPKAWRIVWSEPLVATPWSHSAGDGNRCFYSELNWPLAIYNQGCCCKQFSSFFLMFTHHSGKTSLKILLYFGKPLVRVGSGGQALKDGGVF